MIGCCGPIAGLGAFVPTKELPSFIKAALADVGFHKADIDIKAADKAYLCSSAGDGSRGFVIAVNFDTQQTQTRFGSWGGANMFTNNPIDRCDTETPIPPSGGFIVGTQGGYNSARLYAHPSRVAPLLPAPAPSTLSERDLKILGAYKGLTSAGRKELASHVKGWRDATERLVVAGMLSRNAAGSVAVTLAGKNAIADKHSGWWDDLRWDR